MKELSKINFVFVGMPSSGKSTITSIFSLLLGKKTLSCDKYFDAIINNPSCNIAKKFYQLRFPQNSKPYFNKYNGSEEFIKHYGEKLFRDYEEYLNINILENKEINQLMIDLPGKIFMREKYRQKLKEKNCITIFLNVDQNILIKRLSYNKNWMLRSVYKIAEESGYGWQKRFNDDFNERYNIYSKADIIYTINEDESSSSSVSNIIDALEKYLGKS